MATDMERHYTLAAGDRVTLDSTREVERGVVVDAWISEDLGGLEDCYVALFGPALPEPDRGPSGAAVHLAVRSDLAPTSANLTFAPAGQILARAPTQHEPPHTSTSTPVSRHEAWNDQSIVHGEISLTCPRIQPEACRSSGTYVISRPQWLN